MHGWNGGRERHATWGFACSSRLLVGGVLAVSVVACGAGVRHVDEATPTSSRAGVSTTFATSRAHPNAPASTISTTASPTTTTVVPATPAPTPPPATRPPGAVTTSLAQLGTLAVKGRAPKTGYDREQFGPSWTDDVDVAGGHNGCDTRNDILRRDLTSVVLKPGTRGCVVLTGILDDPYTRKVIAFRRGVGTSTDVQIDHVVPLLDAWQKGAQQLSAEQRPRPRERPDRAARGRWPDERVEGRRRRGDVASPEQGVPLPVRGLAGGGQVPLPPVGHPGRTRGDRADPHRMHRCAGARRPLTPTGELRRSGRRP